MLKEKKKMEEILKNVYGLQTESILYELMTINTWYDMPINHILLNLILIRFSYNNKDPKYEETTQN